MRAGIESELVTELGHFRAAVVCFTRKPPVIYRMGQHAVIDQHLTPSHLRFHPRKASYP